ncbi:MAG TPA: HepT-like ribonuclease domain-containing protein [Stellaceae bacterium]|nr:HepT-like ribonuclease domain-containing protein [Stellaceae bacterium]
MTKDPTIAIRDCLTEIAILHEIEGHTTLQGFRNDPILRRAAAYAIQTISEAVRCIPDDWLADFPTEPWAQIKSTGEGPG